MSVNTLTLKERYEGSELPFELELGEQLLYNSPTLRQVLSIKSDKLSITAKDGKIYLTSLRFIFITASQGDINSFHFMLSSIPSLSFSHQLKSPWFGANYWEFLFKSPNSDSLPLDYYKGQIQFNDGGLFDFVTVFDTRLNDVVNNSHIDDQLPRYEA